MQPASERRLPIFPLFIVVVLAGLALGAFLSQRFSGHTSPSRVVIRSTSVAPLVTPTPLQRAALSTPLAKPSRKPLPTPSSSALPSPSASPATTPTAQPTPRPVRRVALTTPKPAPPRTSAAPVATAAPAAHTTTPARRVAAAPPAPTGGADAAAAVARDYLFALMRGDNRAANSTLGKPPSSLPSFAEQSFLSPTSHINSVHATPNGDGTYKVEAEVASSNGTYFVTFQVRSSQGAYYIADHYAIRVQ
ncbi:MAG: hypothetical protein JOZ97_06450 [Candidatus Eremiobacteraeota bacterium]|nr:hypothetical protein [Candidatus Eremiobacteraeota bacterium]